MTGRFRTILRERITHKRRDWVKHETKHNHHCYQRLHHDADVDHGRSVGSKDAGVHGSMWMRRDYSVSVYDTKIQRHALSERAVNTQQDSDMTKEELAYEHAKAVGWNEAIRAAAALVDNFTYRGPLSGKKQIAAAIRTLDKSMQAIDD